MTRDEQSTGFYFTNHDGYLSLSYYGENDNPGGLGQHVCYIEAGDRLDTINSAVFGFVFDRESK